MRALMGVICGVILGFILNPSNYSASIPIIIALGLFFYIISYVIAKKMGLRVKTEDRKRIPTNGIFPFIFLILMLLIVTYTGLHAGENGLKEFDSKVHVDTMIWNYSTPGIPDEFFERSDKVPITKEEIRSIVLSKLRLKPGYSVIDVGSGSGSITVEICLQVNSKNVYAIDEDENAVGLTKKNLDKFGVSANLIHSKAEEILPSLPTVDAIVIGGTKGKTGKIIELCVSKLRKDGRLVIDTILIETMYNALKSLKNQKMYEIEVTQVMISKGKDFPSVTMLVSRNPILILSATKR